MKESSLFMKLFDYIQSQSASLATPLMGYPGIQLTQSTIQDIILYPERQFEALWALIERFNPPVAFPLMDLTVEASGLGLHVEYPEDDVAFVRKHPLRLGDDLSGLQEIDLLDAPRVKNYLQVIEKVASRFSGIPGGFVIGPLSLAGLLMGVENLALAFLDDPDFVKSLLDILSEKLAALAAEQEKAGAQVVAVLEPTAMIISPEQFRNFVKPAVGRIFERLAGMSLLHICGFASHLVDSMALTGAHGLSLDFQVDLSLAEDLVPPDVVLWGNLDPVGVFLKGTPESVYNEVQALLEKMKGYDNFIPSSGCDLPARTPLENIQAFFDAVREWEKKKAISEAI